MSIIKFPSKLVSTRELSEAIDWNHANLMKDARAVAQEPEMPREWFRPATYRDESGAIQNSYNMTSSGLMMLLWNCSGPRELQRRCRQAMLAIMVVRAASPEAAEENYAKAIIPPRCDGQSSRASLFREGRIRTAEKPHLSLPD